VSKNNPSADASDQTTPQVFYDKLFSALEAGKDKGEKTLLVQMAKDLKLSNEPDLLCDISNSMPRGTLSRATQKLVDANVLPLHTFTFDTTLTELPGGIPHDWPDGGGTEVVTVLETYLTIAHRSPSEKVLILTDADGVTQVTHAMSTGSFAALDMLCLEADELNARSVVAWAER
jgi:hypothetical protein